MDDIRQYLPNLSEAALKYGSLKIHFFKKDQKENKQKQ